ncbi:MAG: hypothetical protein NT136_00500 [Candidatus Moranbacteria bacterium]|nr:hypothetical protein [Candidatus Moranbacteria bacterium]
MKIEIKNIRGNPADLLRRAGYIFQSRKEDEMGFVRPLSSSGYPRFHIFTRVVGGNLIINIHLDQKKETYGEAKRHHGEYESAIIKEEAERIASVLRPVE